MVMTELVEGPLPQWAEAQGLTETGAEVIFHGRVRDREQGQEIVALYYEAYASLADDELRAIGEETASRYSLLDLTCHHRIGEVPVGAVSLRVVARARHREAALEAVTWMVDQLKRRVPIWKWGVLSSGERFPSGLATK